MRVYDLSLSKCGSWEHTTNRVEPPLYFDIHSMKIFGKFGSLENARIDV